MLEELAKKDQLWRVIALKICKDRQLADDIVQEMYMRFHRNPKEKLYDSYVVQVLKSVFLNHIKTEKKEASINGLYYLECKNKTFEPSDEELELLNKFDELNWRQKELIAESYDRSLREIEVIYPMINYGYAFRQIKEGRETVLNDR